MSLFSAPPKGAPFRICFVLGPSSELACRAPLRLAPCQAMPSSQQSSNSAPAQGSGGRFALTRWSIVMAAGRGDSTHAREALEKLCTAYWPPIYAFVRRQGHSHHEAQDLTQEFFARLLGK